MFFFTWHLTFWDVFRDPSGKPSRPVQKQQKQNKRGSMAHRRNHKFGTTGSELAKLMDLDEGNATDGSHRIKIVFGFMQVIIGLYDALGREKKMDLGVKMDLPY